MLVRFLLLFATGCSIVVAQPAATDPASAPIGAKVVVTVTGTNDPRDFVTIVPQAGREGSYGDYKYVSKPGQFTLPTPAEPGDYEIRLLGAQTPYPTLARRPIRLESVAASLVPAAIRRPRLKACAKRAQRCE